MRPEACRSIVLLLSKVTATEPKPGLAQKVLSLSRKGHVGSGAGDNCVCSAAEAFIRSGSPAEIVCAMKNIAMQAHSAILKNTAMQARSATLKNTAMQAHGATLKNTAMQARSATLKNTAMQAHSATLKNTAMQAHGAILKNAAMQVH
ncbi:hypothetical protein NDU88_010123 [Pleurodeles waltl]|uniref:Uncharacterized protein n=1 Tax=Pleurodeles waltl TaxID=8319 RepID=A0AAV7PUU0_PLEWA|nr:hypothetical protein NDU88_010123 [Pleurodeles waltl]